MQEMSINSEFGSESGDGPELYSHHTDTPEKSQSTQLPSQNDINYSRKCSKDSRTLVNEQDEDSNSSRKEFKKDSNSVSYDDIIRKFSTNLNIDEAD